MVKTRRSMLSKLISGVFGKKNSSPIVISDSDSTTIKAEPIKIVEKSTKDETFDDKKFIKQEKKSGVFRNTRSYKNRNPSPIVISDSDSCSTINEHLLVAQKPIKVERKSFVDESFEDNKFIKQERKSGVFRNTRSYRNRNPSPIVISDSDSCSTIKASPIFAPTLITVEKLTIEDESFEGYEVLTRERKSTMISIHSVDDSQQLHIEIDQPCQVSDDSAHI